MKSTLALAIMAVALVAVSGCIVLTSEDSQAEDQGTLINAEWLTTNDTLSDGSYYLNNAITLTKPLTVTGTVTLDLNSKSITYTGTESAFVLNGSSLTITGGTSISTGNGTTVQMSGTSSLTIDSNLSLSGSMTGGSSLTITENAASGVTLKTNFSIESSCTVTNNGSMNLIRSNVNDKNVTISGKGTTTEYLVQGDGVVITKYTMSEGSSSSLLINNTISSLPITGIGANAFAGTDISLIGSGLKITSIGDGAFSNCTNLKSITLKNVTALGNGVFSGCTSLNSVTLAAGCSYDSDAFSGIPTTATVSLGNDKYAVTAEGNLTVQNPDDATFKVGDNYFLSLEAALTAVSDKGEIEMLKDTETGIISISKNVTLNLGGFTLKITGATDKPGISFSGSSFRIENGTIEDSRDSSRQGDCTTVEVKTSQQLTIENVNIEILDASDASNKNNTALLVTSGASVTLTGTTSITSDDENNTLSGSIGVVILGTGSMANTTDLVIDGDVKIDVTQYGIAGNGAVRAEGSETGDDFTGTSISISGDASVSASKGWGIYHPQMGTLTISENASVSGRTGIEMRSGTLDITGGSVTSIDSTTTPTDLETGGSVYGAAIVVSQHSSDQEIYVKISDGEFEGPYALYETDVFEGDPVDVDLAVSGGSFTGTASNIISPIMVQDATSEDGTEPAISGFITGGDFYTKTGETSTAVESMDYMAPGFKYENNGVITDETFTANVTNSNGKVYETFTDAVSEANDGDTLTLTCKSETMVITPITIDAGITLDLNNKTLIIDDEGSTVQREGIKFTSGTSTITNGTIVDARADDETNNNYVTVWIDGISTELTIADAKIQSYLPTSTEEDDDYNYAVRVNHGSAVTLDNVQIVENTPTAGTPTMTSGLVGVAVFGPGDDNASTPSTLTITGNTSIEVTGYAIAGNGSNSEGNDNSCTYFDIQSGTLTSKGTAAIYHPQQGTTVISGGTITGATTGIEIRAGDVTIDGVDVLIKSTAEKLTTSGNTSGITTSGAAVAVVQHTTNLPISLEIVNGSFEGPVALYENNTQQTTATESIEISVSGGDFKSTVEGYSAVQVADVDKFITGGSFNTTPEKDLISDEAILVTGSDGKTTVVDQENADISDSMTITQFTAVGTSITLSSSGATDKTITFTFPGITLTVTGDFPRGAHTLTAYEIIGSAVLYDLAYEIDTPSVQNIDGITVTVKIDIPEDQRYVSATVYRVETDVTKELDTPIYNSTDSTLTFSTPGNSVYQIDLVTEAIPGGDSWAPQPPIQDDDEYVPLPPTYVEQPESTDDYTVEIVACAAAAVVAALMAAFLIISRRD